MGRKRPKSILVTGSRGFIGPHLVSELLKTTAEPIVAVDLAPVPGQNVNPKRQINIQLDVRNPGTLRELFSHFQFAAVFDLASFTDIGASMREYNQNVDITRSMTECVSAFDVPKYIFYSSQFVFRREGVLPRDDQDYYPIEGYGESKVRSEQLIRSTLPPEQWLIVRPTYIWGEGHRRFRDKFLYRLARGQLLVPFSGAVKRYYGYVRTICEQTRKLASQSFSDVSKVFYLSDPPISVRDFCDHFVVALGRGRVWPVPRLTIQALGSIGDLVGRLGLPFPVNGLQANEMTRNYPVPIEPTLIMTETSTDYSAAAFAVVSWALADAQYARRIRA